MMHAETELLRESIDRLTQDARVPAGLADRAFQRHRQRRTALGAVAATGTAVLAAAGVLTAVTAAPGAAPGIASGTAHPAPGGLSAQTTAYVFGRTERALAAAQRENLVEEIHTVGRNYPLGLTRVRTFHLHGQTAKLIEQSGATASQENTWYYRGQLREQGLDAAGRLLFDASSSTAQPPAGQQGLLKVSGKGVDYTSKSWWRAAAQFTLPAPTKNPCKSAYLPPPVGTTINWSAEIHAGLACGHYRLAGHEQIGSVRAIKMVSVKLNGPYTVTLWVDPASYLPMRLTWHWLDHRAPGPGTVTGDFRWVRPTTANLGALRVTVPGGFRRSHTGGLPVPGIDY